MNTQQDYRYSRYAKIIHLGLAALGIAAFLTAEMAEDGGTGYMLHAYLGLSLMAFIVARIIAGLTGAAELSFKGWSPFSLSQWKFALEDFRTLLTLRVPERDRHQGLAGITQAFGLLLFAWMSVTGTGMFLLGTGPETELFEFLEEVHEVGETLIPLYLALHVGAVVLHTLSGSPVWKKMFASS